MVLGSTLKYAMKVCLLTAALGTLDRIVPPAPQVLPAGVELTVVGVTDATFPPRSQTMTPRMQSRIVKMFGWEMFPGYDVYLWVDASFSCQTPDSVAWMLRVLGEGRLATFAHPERSTCKSEAAFIQKKVLAGNRYLTPRYAGELIEAQMKALSAPGFIDDRLFATMVVAYRPTTRVKSVLREWWVHTSRYHAVDQLALPFIVWQFGVPVVILPGDPYHCDQITLVRGK